MKNIFFSILTFGAINLFGTVITVPNLTEKEEETYLKYEYPFNGEKPFCKAIQKLKNKFQLTTAVETGTFHGHSTEVFEDIFDRVDTFEIHQECIDIAKSRSVGKGIANYHLGNSGKIMSRVLKNIKKERVLFYLDAHWGAYWPLRDEFRQIKEFFKDDCIVMIDDIKVPGYKNVGYDKYKGIECSYEYVKDVADQLFSSYKVYHLITENQFRGKLLLVPDSYSGGKELTMADFR